MCLHFNSTKVEGATRKGIFSPGIQATAMDQAGFNANEAVYSFKGIFIREGDIKLNQQSGSTVTLPSNSCAGQ